MKSDSDNRLAGGPRRRRGFHKDSFWGFIVLAAFVVVPAMYGFVAWTDSQTGSLAGGIADEAGATALVRTVVLVAQAQR